MAETLKYSELRSHQRRNLLDLIPLSAPFSVFLEPTSICNFRCVNCPLSLADYADKAPAAQKMDFDLYRKILDDIAELGRLKSMKFYMMGEPLSNPRTPEMIRLAHERGVCERSELTTNASLLSEEKSRELLTSGLTYLRVSVYSIDAERNRRITGSSIAPDRIFENIRRFRQMRDAVGAGPQLYVKMLDAQSDENEAFLNLYRPIADEAAIEPVMNWDGFGEKNFQENLYGRNVGESEYFSHHKEVCPFAFYSLVICANGDVTICCVDWSHQTKVGNLQQETLREIWEGERLRAFRLMQIERRQSENNSCRDCTYLHTTPDNIDEIVADRLDKR